MNKKNWKLTWTVFNLLHVRVYFDREKLIKDYEWAVISGVNNPIAYENNEILFSHPSHGWNNDCEECKRIKQKRMENKNG